MHTNTHISAEINLSTPHDIIAYTSENCGMIWTVNAYIQCPIKGSRVTPEIVD